MTPGDYTYLQIVNATAQDLNQGQAGPGFFNQYQMNSWFGFPNAPTPICATASRSTHQVQFLEGVGDEDDAADLQLNVGDQNDPANAIVWIQARSTSTSGHYLTYQFQHPTSSLFIYGISSNGGWDQITAGDVTWGIVRNDTTGQYPTNDATNSLALVDLNQMFPGDPATAQEYFAAVYQGVTPAQAETLFDKVASYIHLAPALAGA